MASVPEPPTSDTEPVELDWRPVPLATTTVTVRYSEPPDGLGALWGYCPHCGRAVAAYIMGELVAMGDFTRDARGRLVPTNTKAVTLTTPALHALDRRGAQELVCPGWPKTTKRRGTTGSTEPVAARPCRHVLIVKRPP